MAPSVNREPERMELDCIHNTINLIDTHYNQPISITDLERVSFYSYRNIQRIFKYTCRETIGAYQQRLKVERAYKLILYTTKAFSDIALEVGFDNVASFSKAFKQRFGLSPKTARQQKPVLLEQNAIVPTLAKEAIVCEKVYLPTRTVYYQSIFTDYNNPDIEDLWAKVMRLELPEQGVDYFGIIADEPLITEKIKCRYDACVSVLPKNKELPSKTMLGGRYARFWHRGSYDTIEETYQKIYAGWILTTQLEFSAAPIIEHYIKHDSNTAHEADFLTAILIPLNV
ncbi:MAG: AraC family transcriptional regulator [Saprospiraceae bacterium]|nr:AraC family transcriptional regulator [Saprospiraceae bacterium]